VTSRLARLGMLWLAFVFAGCAQQSVDRGPLPAKLTNVSVTSISLDARWAVASSRLGEGNSQPWFGVIDKFGKPAFAMSERDPHDAEALDGTVEATAWSPDSHFVACRVRKGHHVDDFTVARLSTGGWKPVLLPHAFVLEEQYSKLPELRGRSVQQTSGDAIESLRWTSNRTLRIAFQTTLTVDDASSRTEPRYYRFRADADCTFTSSRPQVRWSGASLSPLH